VWRKPLVLPHVLMHSGVAHAGGERLRHARSEPVTLLALVSAVRLALAPGLPPWDRRLADETLSQAVHADWRRRLPRPPMDRRPSPAVEGFLRRLGGTPLDGGSDEATERWVRARQG
jgi:hypothetical protein